MRIPRLFLDKKIEPGNIIILPDDQSHYLKNVLRRKNNDPIVIFNNAGSFSANIIYSDNSVQIMPQAKLKEPDATAIKINLFQAACQNKKMELIIQKATELGISSITPIITTRSKVNKSDHKYPRWKQIAIEACEQADRNTIPAINEANTIQNLSFDSYDINLVLHPFDALTLKDLRKPAQVTRNINIFIGPEGGFTDEEREIFRLKGFKSIKFGPRIMRTETAAIAVIAAINTLWGDCG